MVGGDVGCKSPDLLGSLFLTTETSKEKRFRVKKVLKTGEWVTISTRAFSPIKTGLDRKKTLMERNISPCWCCWKVPAVWRRDVMGPLSQALTAPTSLGPSPLWRWLGGVAVRAHLSPEA